MLIFNLTSTTRTRVTMVLSKYNLINYSENFFAQFFQSSILATINEDTLFFLDYFLYILLPSEMLVGQYCLINFY
jgi:hypothetical protein